MQPVDPSGWISSIADNFEAVGKGGKVSDVSVRWFAEGAAFTPSPGWFERFRRWIVRTFLRPSQTIKIGNFHFQLKKWDFQSNAAAIQGAFSQAVLGIPSADSAKKRQLSRAMVFALRTDEFPSSTRSHEAICHDILFNWISGKKTKQHLPYSPPKETFLEYAQRLRADPDTDLEAFIRFCEAFSLIKDDAGSKEIKEAVQGLFLDLLQKRFLSISDVEAFAKALRSMDEAGVSVNEPILEALSGRVEPIWVKAVKEAAPAIKENGIDDPYQIKEITEALNVFLAVDNSLKELVLACPTSDKKAMEKGIRKAVGAGFVPIGKQLLQDLSDAVEKRIDEIIRTNEDRKKAIQILKNLRKSLTERKFSLIVIAHPEAKGRQKECIKKVDELLKKLQAKKQRVGEDDTPRERPSSTEAAPPTANPVPSRVSIAARLCQTIAQTTEILSAAEMYAWMTGGKLSDAEEMAKIQFLTAIAANAVGNAIPLLSRALRWMGLSESAASLTAQAASAGTLIGLQATQVGPITAIAAYGKAIITQRLVGTLKETIQENIPLPDGPLSIVASTAVGAVSTAFTLAAVQQGGQLVQDAASAVGAHTFNVPGLAKAAQNAAPSRAEAVQHLSNVCKEAPSTGIASLDVAKKYEEILRSGSPQAASEWLQSHPKLFSAARVVSQMSREQIVEQLTAEQPAAVPGGPTVWDRAANIIEMVNLVGTIYSTIAAVDSFFSVGRTSVFGQTHRPGTLGVPTKIPSSVADLGHAIHIGGNHVVG